MTSDETPQPEARSSDELASELEARGHVNTSWDELGSLTLPVTDIETSQYRIGPPDDPASPTVFKVYFPPDCRVEAHKHACNYSEIILQGSQQVSGRWLHEGDIRIGLADQAYGPLIAGPEGVTVLVIFADGHWPAIPVGAGDGETLGVDQLTGRFSSA